ncbi:hydrolase [Rhodobacteraceae bacterium KLH11]|nr:hydrolase [Rhodobacteraceae bacterium KLH11]
MTLTTLRLSETGSTVTFRDHGRGQPVLLVHGVGMQSAAWEPQIDTLGRFCRVIAVDLPGHGGSARLAIGSQLPDFVSWLHAVIKRLEVGPVALAGHSMGALIAAGSAASFPEHVSRVALLNGVFCRTPSARASVAARAAEIRAGKMDLETPLSRWFGGSSADTAARARVSDWLGAVDPEGYATAYTAFAQGDTTYANQMGRITCPFLAITGEADPNSTPAMSEAMAAAVGKGRAVVVKGHRHMVNLTAPDTVNAHLVEWLNQPGLQRVTQ